MHVFSFLNRDITFSYVDSLIKKYVFNTTRLYHTTNKNNQFFPFSVSANNFLSSKISPIGKNLFLLSFTYLGPLFLAGNPVMFFHQDVIMLIKEDFHYEMG